MLLNSVIERELPFKTKRQWLLAKGTSLCGVNNLNPPPSLIGIVFTNLPKLRDSSANVPKRSGSPAVTHVHMILLRYFFSSNCGIIKNLQYFIGT